MDNRIIVHSGTSIAAANKIFNEMHQLTTKLYCLTPAEAICSKGSKKRWSDLADVWMTCAEDACEYSVFDLVLHKIYWGVYPEPMNAEYTPLAQLVEVELISDGPAYAAWRKHSSYKFAFYHMKDQEKALVHRGPRPHSCMFSHYQNSRYWLNVVYKGRKPELIDPGKATLHDMKAAKVHDSIYATCKGFEQAINCLIPNSVNWTDEQWLNDLNIRRELKKLYNVNYASYDQNFEILMAGLMNKLYYNAPIHLAQLLKLNTIPMKIVQRIWPEETDKTLKKLFLDAVGRAKNAETRVRNGKSSRHGLHSYQKLVRSWLFMYIYNQLAHQTPTNKFDYKVKRKLFEVAANI